MGRRKPRGHLGYLSFGYGTPEFRIVALPESKEDIEQWMVDAMLRTHRAKDADPYALVGTPVRNPEANFDFTLPTARGDEYLDLMEIVVFSEDSSSPGHEAGPLAYDPDAMAEAIVEMVLVKSQHYGRPRTPLHLLLYVTDWRFELLQPVDELVALALASRPHIFRTVSYFGPCDAETGMYRRLFPLTSDNLAQYAAINTGVRSLILLADLRKGRLLGPGTMVFAISFKGRE